MRRLLFALAVVLAPAAANAAATDCSGTIAAARTPITLISNPSPTPSIVLLQNVDDQEALWFSFGAVTVQEKGPGSFILPPSQAKAATSPSIIFLQFPAAGAPLTKLSVVAATAGHKVSCAYW